MSDTQNTRVVTPEAIISFPYLWEPYEGGDGEPKFSASFIFLEGTDITVLRRAAIAAGVAKWGEATFTSMVKNGQARMPFREDWETKGYPEGSIFVNARSKNRPGVVEPFAGPDGRPLQLTDRDKMFAGCKVRASLTAFGYDRKGNKGVSFALNNVQWLATGERLDNRVAAQDEFDAPQTAPASLEDLL
jgi:hypothetical protein